ncbi:nucleus protein [Colletotrichum karsti]|uniref:Nucleus protein n=1 Tax=Colletotrichum karsti TaxID=1095194 RepID=A0A9P6I118_9PEZI|nr:nucleus protein [Colletotrichum karsti]KAF9874294.1 nucleus protein [Colletotrichum karsti]
MLTNRSGNHQMILRKWYESALFFLNESEFMRRNDIRVVQAIAILGMCFYNFGDSELSCHLWSCAIRIAQALGLDGSHTENACTDMSLEAKRRLWWTLVICEWLAVPYHVPQVEEGDFNVPLPSMDPNSDLPGGIQPVQYHIFMSRTSIVYHRFRSALREGTRAIAEIVRLADDELAEVINTLPEHLQPDGGKNPEIQDLEIAHPWIKWQRFDISLVLLHHRMRINRALQNQWLESPGQYDWARAVCIRSAMDIIWITHNWDQPAAMRRQW